MSLRTYSLITHPAFLRHIESIRFHSNRFENVIAADVPDHRPLLKQASDIGRYIGISPLVVLGLIKNADNHYRTFEFTKRSGGTREINTPRTYLKVIQWWILDAILAGSEPSVHAHGFVKGRSFVTNARFHHGARHVLNLDIENFFPSISLAQVASAFQSLGFRAGLCEDLARLTTFEGRLPQGAPTSPALANLIMRRTDSQLAELAARSGLKYSRYADDLTFSSHNRIPVEIIREVTDILAPLALRLNTSKTRFMGPNQKIEVTGLILAKGDVALDRRHLNKLRGWFHSVAKNPTSYKGHYKRLQGTLALLTQVGGRGTDKLIQSGQLAIQGIELANRIG